MRTLRTGHGDLELPAFLPDATRGAVRALDSADSVACGVAGLMVNTVHLASRPGSSVISTLGGIHSFIDWAGPVFSDSGGFQVFSLTAGSPPLANVSKDGFSYRFDRRERKRNLTPETCVRKQFQMGSDVIFCLDHCTHPDSSPEIQRQSVEHTIEWAASCKGELKRLKDNSRRDGYDPLLFAVIQGGSSHELRRTCAEQLLEIGFDGFGFGGWPIDTDGGLVETVEYVSELVPAGVPKHALGIGKPENVVAAFKAGYLIFDCVIPTRDARHKRLYVYPGGEPKLGSGDTLYERIYIDDGRNVKEKRPIDEGCDCPCCTRYSRAYLHHLFNVDDHLAYRLATIHNVRFYARLMDALRAEVRRNDTANAP